MDESLSDQCSVEGDRAEGWDEIVVDGEALRRDAKEGDTILMGGRAE